MPHLRVVLVSCCSVMDRPPSGCRFILRTQPKTFSVIDEVRGYADHDHGWSAMGDPPEIVAEALHAIARRRQARDCRYNKGGCRRIVHGQIRQSMDARCLLLS